MTKTEFKEMFLECFTLELSMDYDCWVNVRLKDADTNEVILESYVAASEIVQRGSSD